MQTRHSYLWKAGVVVLCGGGLCICYAYHSTSRSLDKMMQTNVMDYKKKKADYIYLSEMKFHPMVAAEGGIHEDPLIINAIYNWWNKFQKSVAWRHVHMAHDKDRCTRLRAVRHLAKASNLTDSDYRMIAQALDARTAIGLGRMHNSDIRFFLPPPPTKPLELPELKDKLLELMRNLERIRPHGCLSSFLLNRKRKEQVETNETYSLYPDFDEETVLKGLEVLLHHSNIVGHGEAMMTLGCLPLLMEIYRMFEERPHVLFKLFSLISNLTGDVNREYRLKDFFASGWIGVLVKYSRESSARLSLPCHRALANLDPDEPFKYDHRLFLLHPFYRTNVPCEADVIFVHGLLGAVYYTWRSGNQPDVDHPSADISLVEKFRRTLKMDEFTKELEDEQQDTWKIRGHDFEFVLADLPERALREGSSRYSYPGESQWVRDVLEKEESTSCWPRDWLPKDCPNIRVLAINYSTTVSQWLPQCPDADSGLTITQRGQQFMRMLTEAGVGQKPIVWVTHSMGGLIVKNLLVEAYEAGKSEFENLYRNTKGIIFLTVPHVGSEVADLGFAAELLMMPSIEVQELRYRSPALVSLHMRFLQMLQVVPMQIVSFGESVPTFYRPMVKPQFIVDPFSADPGVGEFFEVPRNHMDICKPSGRHSFIYRKVVEMARSCSKTIGKFQRIFRGNQA